jgi:hypothetical protein
VNHPALFEKVVTETADTETATNRSGDNGGLGILQEGRAQESREEIRGGINF